MYKLKNGKTAHNMKHGCELLSISSERFRAKVRGGEIIKVKQSKSDKNGRMD